MPRCHDQWRRVGNTEVGVTATSSGNQFYSLIYMFFSGSAGNDAPGGGSFGSAELAQGVTWQVPEGYRCIFEIVSTGNTPITTTITLDEQPASCHDNYHCQGQCKPDGSAGLAGRWAVTAVRRLV